MFTGIIEEVGEVVDKRAEGGNFHYTIKASFVDDLQVDQSIAHNGVCLTVTELQDDKYTVCAIQETLDKTSLGGWIVGTQVNLERAMKLGDRLDGHMVQGHVDTVATCVGIEEQDGSWVFKFEYKADPGNITVEKGSICINGISLTVVNSSQNSFSVAIIPYTFEHTNFHDLSIGDKVNLEFDVIGKYVARIIAAQN